MTSLQGSTHTLHACRMAASSSDGTGTAVRSWRPRSTSVATASWESLPHRWPGVRVVSGRMVLRGRGSCRRERSALA
jgi:hypothetical protein